MKMNKENYNIILTVFKENKKVIENHKNYLLNNAKFKDLNIRLAFDVWNSSLITREVKNRIMQYDSNDSLNDNHLQTALLKALTEIGLKEDKTA